MKPIRLYPNNQITIELVIKLIKISALKGAMLAQQDIKRERMEAAEAQRA